MKRTVTKDIPCTVVTFERKEPDKDCSDCLGTGKWKQGNYVCPCTFDYTKRIEVEGTTKVEFEIA